MSAFHYKAKKVSENQSSVTYQLCVDFIFDSESSINVVIRKEDREILNFEDLKTRPEFSFSLKPLYWLRAKCTTDKIEFKDELRHLA
jgi:hypothetical protein